MLFQFLKFVPLPFILKIYPAGIWIVCCVFFIGCAGPVQPAQTSIAAPDAGKADAGEPVQWSQALRQKKEWYATPEAIRIADNLLLYQRDNGGWNKNTDMAKVLTPNEKEVLRSEAEKGGVATIDNKATFTQMEFLARVYETTGQEKYKAGFLRGMDFLLAAQYENGGWPQFYPIRKGYYEHITFNDGAMMGVMQLLREVARHKTPYAFVDQSRRKQAGQAVKKGVEVILKTQIKVNGSLTAWCAQHDRTSFAPQKARAYELPSISGGESIGIVKFLMEMEHPGPDVIQAVESAVRWMQGVKIQGIRLEKAAAPAMDKGYDLVVVKDPAAPRLLARFYEIGTNRPMFVGRDGRVRETLAEIEQERRIGYSWYIPFPQDLLEQVYPVWKQKWVIGTR